jgi:diamine N-acetyltransferase
LDAAGREYYKKCVWVWENAMIFGDRVRLRRNERSDIPRFVEWLNDPEVRRYLSMIYPISQVSEEHWFEHMLTLPVSEQPYAIEIPDETSRKSSTEQAAQWRMIGNCSYMNISWTDRSAEVGLFIGDKTCWNKGFGTEVMRLLLQYGFGTMNLNRIFLRVDEDNKGGVRAYEKAGFTHEGRFRQGSFRNGEYHDVLFMSVLHQEWNNQKKGQP